MKNATQVLATLLLEIEKQLPTIVNQPNKDAMYTAAIDAITNLEFPEPTSKNATMRRMKAAYLQTDYSHLPQVFDNEFPLPKINANAAYQAIMVVESPKQLSEIY